MKTEDLNRLLGKYYNGESTEDDERTLREFFSKKTVPEGYEAEKAIFGFYFSGEKNPEPSPDFENRILAAIDQSESRKKSHKLRRYILPYLSAAAGLLIVAASYFFLTHQSEPRDTFTDPELAYAETMKILMDVSYQLNQGAEALEPVTRMNKMTTKSFQAINKSAKIVEDNLKSLDYLQKAIEMANAPVEKSINK